MGKVGHRGRPARDDTLPSPSPPPPLCEPSRSILFHRPSKLPTPNSLAPRYSPIRRRFCMNRHHDRSVDRSWHRVRGTKSKAKPVTPGSRAEPTSDTSCPPRGPHHFVLASFSFLVSLFEPLLSSSHFIILPSSLLAKSLSSIPLSHPRTPPSLYAFLLRPAFASLLSYSFHSPSCSLLPPVLLAARSPANRSRPPRVCPRRADLPLRRLPGVAARAHEVPSAWRRSRKTREKRLPLERRRLATCELSFHSANFDRSKGNFYSSIFHSILDIILEL